MRRQDPVFSSLFPFLIGVLLIVGINLWQIERKEGTYIDEVFTLMVMSGTFDDSIAAKVPAGTISAETLRTRFLDLRHTEERLTALRHGTGDIMWTNAYYSLAQAVVGGHILKTRDDVLNALGRLRYLNVFLLIVCLTVGYLTLRRCNLTQWESTLSLLILYGSPAVTSTVLLARGFVLALLASTVYLYVFVCQYQALSEQGRISYALFTASTLSIAFCLLAAYNLIPLILLSQAWLFVMAWRKRHREALLQIAAPAVAFLLALMAYPNYLLGCSAEGYAGTPAQILTHFQPAAFITKLAYLIYHLHFNVAWLLPVTLPLLAALSHRNREKNDTTADALRAISVCSWTALVVIWIIAPYRATRYLVPLLPGALVVIPTLIKRLPSRKQHLVWGLMIALTLLPHFWRGSVELQQNKNPLLRVKEMFICPQAEHPQMEAALLPLIDDNTRLVYDTTSVNTSLPRVTTALPGAKGERYHRFLVVEKQP